MKTTYLLAALLLVSSLARQRRLRSEAAKMSLEHRLRLKLPSAALIAVAMLATPAMARTSHVTSWHRAKDANASASPTARYIDGRVGISAPRVGAFPPAPNCDVGDNPHIC